jgi:hypothetical protein
MLVCVTKLVLLCKNINKYILIILLYLKKYLKNIYLVVLHPKPRLILIVVRVRYHSAPQFV